MAQSLLVGAHLLVGGLALGAAVAAMVLAAPRALANRPPPDLYRPLHRAASALVVAAIVVGALLYVTSHRPAHSLHYLYAAAALLVMPVADALGRQDPSRARFYQLGGTALLAGVMFRLFTT